MTMISPSLLAADFLHLEQELDMINRSEADWLHLDRSEERRVGKECRSRWSPYH